MEYDILGEVSHEKTPVLTQERAPVFWSEMPTNPAEASLTSELAACTASQLQFTSLPLMQKPLINVRAYQARNISTKTCSVTGIPKLRFMDGKIDNVYYLPKACPNCVNDGFVPTSKRPDRFTTRR